MTTKSKGIVIARSTATKQSRICHSKIASADRGRLRNDEKSCVPCSNQRPSYGFTLIESVVVVAVMTVLAAMFIGYSRGGSVQIKILKDKSALIGALYRARALAIQTYQYSPPECGYGIHVFKDENPPRRFVLWRDTAGNGDCNDKNPSLRANGAYDAAKDSNGDGVPDEDVEFFALEPGLKFGNTGEADFMEEILFIPPEPRVARNKNPGLAGPLVVTISSLDGASVSRIVVTDYGQVEE
ncbi:MAG: prepilin-type N-terminal cleavage/methylation domain-containing protein [Candidatus Harrisonbacteria bacterium]|nr:prepilin-type N-terminal cleavage/methylation domain-containing protein [Candidatus Harrisonbacteria bacterium]